MKSRMATGRGELWTLSSNWLIMQQVNREPPPVAGQVTEPQSGMSFRKMNLEAMYWFN